MNSPVADKICTGEFFYVTGNFVEFSCEAGLFLIFLIAPKRTEC